MESQNEIEHILINLLCDLKRIAVTDDREAIYYTCRNKFEHYIAKRPADPVKGHTDACLAATGDAVDTCECHFYTHTSYHRALVRDCLDAYWLYKPFEHTTPVFTNQVTEDPKKSVFSKFRRVMTCFVSCREADGDKKSPI